MITEYFNMRDENCQKVTAETLAVVLKRQSDHLLSQGISVSGTTEDGMSTQIGEIIEKCYRDIDESPESVTAIYACDLLSVLLTKTNPFLQLYILQNFLVAKIIDHLLEGVDEHMHEDHVHSELGK
jgi:hypothetical protein